MTLASSGPGGPNPSPRFPTPGGSLSPEAGGVAARGPRAGGGERLRGSGVVFRATFRDPGWPGVVAAAALPTLLAPRAGNLAPTPARSESPGGRPSTAAAKAWEEGGRLSPAWRRLRFWALPLPSSVGRRPPGQWEGCVSLQN